MSRILGYDVGGIVVQQRSPLCKIVQPSSKPAAHIERCVHRGQGMIIVYRH